MTPKSSVQRRAGLACLLAALAVAACAHRAPREQTIEVRLESELPSLAGPLTCEASNPLGSWPFSAPGTVTVLRSASPLKIACQAPPGAVAEPSVASPVPGPRGERWREGAATGAAAGAAAGVALGAAAAPVMGATFAILIAAGAVLKGGEIGGIVGAARSGETSAYPSPIVLRIKSQVLENPPQ